MSTEAIKKAVRATEEEFVQLVKGSWLKRPKIATVGSCCLVGVIADNALYVANLGDSRAVLGHRGPNGRGVVAERLSKDHNVADEEVRKEVSEQHRDDPRIVVLAKGVWRIKGIIQVPIIYHDSLYSNGTFLCIHCYCSFISETLVSNIFW
jgi:pyruvate dehydrogenase phosphatase